MKLAFNIDYVYPMNTGIGRYGVELMKACIDLEVPCEVWMTRYMRKFKPISKEISRRTVYYPWPRRITDHFWPQLETSRLGIDWVHSANCDLLPRRKAFQQICMIHDMGPYLYGHMKNQKDTGIWIQRIKSVTEKADCITVNSKSTMDDLLTVFPEVSGKVFLTPLGIDHFRKRPGKTECGDHILNVGTVEPRKNVDGLLRAYSVLYRNRDIPPLVIAGKDGFRAEEYKALAVELGVEEAVRFTGYITDEELENLYSRAVCLVHPAHHEGFGFTVPEGFAWGLPVAATSSGGIKEFFSECIWPIQSDSTESIMEGIEKALDCKVSPAQAEARKKVANELTWRNCAVKTIRAMETLSGENSSR